MRTPFAVCPKCETFYYFEDLHPLANLVAANCARGHEKTECKIIFDRNAFNKKGTGE